MHDGKSLSHVRWDCKYHVVIVRIHRQLLRERRMTGVSFWATGYCVSTVGLDEEAIRRYIQEQDQLESGQGQLGLK